MSSHSDPNIGVRLRAAGRPEHVRAVTASEHPGRAKRLLQILLDHSLLTAAIFSVVVVFSAVMLFKLGISPVGWDLHVYVNAIHALRLGHDPYVDGTTVQRIFHTSPQAHDPNVMTPYTYVYSPITLPLLGLIGRIPFAISGPIYWALYLVSLVVIAWACLQSTEPREHKAFLLLAPMTPFFPGLLQTNAILSGNVVYMLYAAVLAAAVLGWRKNIWSPFYVAVFLASCFKAPLLSLVVIPLLSARKQWVGTIITSALGLAAFALQPVLWPSLFHNYLDAVSLQFSYNSDFGFSPAGMLGEVLFYFGKPYSTASTLFYVVYAAAVLAALIYLAYRYFDGEFPIERWVPVMLLGVILLNPRIKEYDVAPLSLPLAMVAWRLFARRNTFGRALLEIILFAIAINAFASLGSQYWKPTAGLLLPGLFLAGAWQLLHGHKSSLAPFLISPLTPARQ